MEGPEIEAPVSKSINRAVAYAIWALSSALSGWLLITAIRWW